MPYFLGGCPTPAAPPTARPRLEAPGAVDLAATAVWRAALAASSSAASRQLLCEQDLAMRRDLGGGEKPSTGIFFLKEQGEFFERRQRACGGRRRVEWRGRVGTCYGLAAAVLAKRAQVGPYTEYIGPGCFLFLSIYSTTIMCYIFVGSISVHQMS